MSDDIKCTTFAEGLKPKCLPLLYVCTKSEQTSMKTGETGLMYSSSTLMDTTISTIVHPAIQYQTVLH